MGTGPVILIGGPTASGKSVLAMRLAEEVGGVIINADSMQVYADLAILTARPVASDEARCKHHLFGFLDASTPCSAGLWHRRARGICLEVSSSGRVPIVVGGTGLYLNTFREGLAPIPDIPGDVRERIRQRLSLEGPEALHAELGRTDPSLAAVLFPTDSQRIARAHEVHEATGTRRSEWMTRSREGEWEGPLWQISLLPDRSLLFERAVARFDRMMAVGALEEAAAFRARRLDPSLPATRCVGLASLMAHLSGRLTLDEACDDAKRATRRYARRQFTWFRHQSADASLLHAFGDECASDIIARARCFLSASSTRLP
ncbi:MAG: tRNA (adenosine(37)-N6)-dimethylallyltransferase MiaA [Alphaproteobacteria bacterium]|nr:tRNA (adenosine(37)-N6)-dimethylallyltransferase MiaA [Alphaproteobacteria bacterium]